MFSQIPAGHLCRAAALAGLVFGSAALVSAANAGECPADQVKANVREPVDFKATGVTDTVLAANDLSKEPIKAEGRMQRVRKLVIQPGGIVPWHSHDDRPALIYVAEGEILEYASNCAGPILHKAGEVRVETHGTSHWWKNLSDKQVVLFIGDVLHDPNDHNM